MDTPLDTENEKVKNYFLEFFPTSEQNFKDPIYHKIPTKWMKDFQQLNESFINLSLMIIELGNMAEKQRKELEPWLDSFMRLTIEGATYKMLKTIEEQKVKHFVKTIPKMDLVE